MPNNTENKIDEKELSLPAEEKVAEKGRGLDLEFQNVDEKDVKEFNNIRFSVSPLVTLAAASVIKPEATVMNVSSGAGVGAVTMTSNPSISDGVNGQLLILRGNHATDTITLTDGNGMQMAGNVTLALNDTIGFYFDGVVTNDWIEIFRSAN